MFVRIMETNFLSSGLKSVHGIDGIGSKCGIHFKNFSCKIKIIKIAVCR